MHRTAETLTRYRLRPVPWVLLIGLSAAWAVTVSLISRTGTITDASSFFLMLKSCALIAGLGAAFTVSEDVDPPEILLRGAPTPFWRAPGLRVVLWLLVGGGILLVLPATLDAERVPNRSIGLLWESFLPDFFLISSLCLLAASLVGSYLGGGVSLAAVGALAFAGAVVHGFPIRLADAPPDTSDPVSLWHRWEVNRLSTLILGIVLLAASFFVAAGRQPRTMSASAT